MLLKCCVKAEIVVWRCLFQFRCIFFKVYRCKMTMPINKFNGRNTLWGPQLVWSSNLIRLCCGNRLLCQRSEHPGFVLKPTCSRSAVCVFRVYSRRAACRDLRFATGRAIARGTKLPHTPPPHPPPQRHPYGDAKYNLQRVGHEVFDVRTPECFLHRQFQQWLPHPGWPVDI